LGEPIIPPASNSTSKAKVQEEDWWNGKVMWFAIGIAGAVAVITMGGMVYYCFKKEPVAPVMPQKLPPPQIS
jgi:hypothetical protein